MNIGIQTLPTATESRDSVSSVAVCRCVSGQVSTVRRRWPLLSAPARPLGCHGATPSASRPHFPPRCSLSSPLRPRRAPPRIGRFARALLSVSSQANQPKASPEPPLPRRHLLGHCRARVRWHCQAPSRSSSPEFRPSSPATWPGLPAPPFLLIFVPRASP